MAVTKTAYRFTIHLSILRKIFALCLFVCFVANGSFAEEPEYLKRSIRAMGMGNAFVAVANDGNALYYNPAGLQSLQYHIYEFLSIGATYNKNLEDLSELDSSNTTAAFGNLVGRNVHTEIDLAALNILAPGWGYSFFGGFRLSSSINNPVIPYFKLKTYVQYGLIFGLASDFRDEELDIGVSLKQVSRQGIGKIVHMVDLLDDDFASQIEDEFVLHTKQSYDLGAIYHFDQISNFEIRAACVLRNIGGMDFGGSGMVPMSMDVGLASESEYAGIDILMAIDYIDLTNALTEFRSIQRNLKMGAEAGVFKRSNGRHTLSARFGLNGLYLTYGFSINVPYLPLNIDFAVWSEEIGNVAGEIEDRRRSLQLSFTF